MIRCLVAEGRGEAVVDVANWNGRGLIGMAVETFGGLDILVNNAGILRDRLFANMSEEEWDAVIRVHLKGHAAPARHAMAYWRDEAKAGRKVAASIVHTTSLAGLIGNFGQANYASAKLAVVGLSRTLALEGLRSGGSNAVSPRPNPYRGFAEGAAERVNSTCFLRQCFAPCLLARLEDCPATGRLPRPSATRIEVIAPDAK